MSKLRYGDAAAREVSGRIGSPVADATALAAIPADQLVDGETFLKLDDNTSWRYNFASTAADATSNLVITPGHSTGRFIRTNSVIDLKLAIAYTTADAAVLFTVPTGFRVMVRRCFWEPTVAFTGGSSSAIGLSSSNAGASTKGDLLGGATGDVLASLTAGFPKAGTVGTKIASDGVVALVAGDTIRFDRITSAFTAGTGFAHVRLEVLAN